MGREVYNIKNVEFNFENNYIQVANNYGNRIEMPSREIAREVYKAIKDGQIDVLTDSLGSFKTIRQIKDYIDILEGE